MATNGLWILTWPQGQPRIVFDVAPPTGGWNDIKVTFEDLNGSAQAQSIGRIRVKWTGKIPVQQIS